MKYNKLFELKNKTAVVTGACGVLGKEFSIALAQYGSRVAIVDLDKSSAERLARSITKKYNIECMGISCDVSDEIDVKKMATIVEKKLGKIDILLNNAATKGKSLDEFFKPLEEYSLDTWKEIMSVNLDGMYIVAKEIGMRMAKRKKGSIIQTASIYSSLMASDQRIYKGSKYLDKEINTPAAYSVSKSGVVGLTLHLASYWARDNVRVNTISPGGVFSGQNKNFVDNYSKRVPMNRMANKEEIVGAIIYLASDASSYVTGQNLYIDGGLSGW
ncbi:MAG: NAD(P)-dependent dehydrogenase (short-subunit alcohol dehydrogenase family) [Gammaproteobacteria bacterium]|jgi:NAD(P)-dependent dehydrogenase (short-subunit alcohol dehydrogenase family)|tara:strand:+ start:6601 stop:7419 length:819 start_codon:yes stop_codon:yes gene_type:complete